MKTVISTFFSLTFSLQALSATGQQNISQSNISQHLGILKDKGVLVTRKEANKVFYRVSDERTLKLLEMMRDVFCSSGH